MSDEELLKMAVFKIRQTAGRLDVLARESKSARQRSALKRAARRLVELEPKLTALVRFMPQAVAQAGNRLRASQETQPRGAERLASF